MQYLELVPENMKKLVTAVVENDNLSFDDKMKVIEGFQINNQLEEDAVNRIREHLTPKIDFISLIADHNTKILAEHLTHMKNFDFLRKILIDQPPEVLEVFENYVKTNTSGEKTKKPVNGNTNDNPNKNKKESKKTTPTLESSSDESSEESQEEEEEDEDANWTPNITKEFFAKFPDCLNILVLGETGVGKSTFINGLANYLKYSNMYEAEKKGAEILIPVDFTHTDKDYNQMKIQCNPTIEMEPDEHVAECLEAGQSSTQAYQFEWGIDDQKKKITIIDTPGVNDCRGLEKEQENFAGILQFIADYKEIHAILILLKPNEARMTVVYRYCINELLTHLHVSACRNILFCFTNARTTFYRPGETIKLLEEHLNRLHLDRGIRIPLQPDTVFCYDNESFRFLCAWKQKAYFTSDEKKDFNKSWQITVEETFRMFKKISELPSHNVEDTLSVNNIRAVVLAMARPLAEIAKNQMANAQFIDEKLKEVEDLMKQGKDLNTAQLYVDQIVVVAKEIGYPVTVCTSEKCVQVIKLAGGIWENEYKQKCHPHCGLTGVQTGLVPNPQIKRCACFNCNINRCNVCTCDWTTHLHIRYELQKTTQRIIDPTVQDGIKNCQNKAELAKKFIEAENKKKVALEAESKLIRSHCVEFAAFLKKNSIIPYNDVYKEYVTHLIREENGKVSQGGSDMMLKQLQKYRDEYEQQIKILGSHGASSNSNKSMRDIYAMLDELKNLKNCGSLLNEIRKLEMLSVRQEQKNKVVNVNIRKGWMDGIYQQKTGSTKAKFSRR